MEMHEIADRHYDAIHKRDDAIEQAELQTEAAFLNSIQEGSAKESAEWADMVRSGKESRHKTVAEVMIESLDFVDGPQMEEVMQFLISMTIQKHPIAVDLTNRMAKKYAAMFTPEVDE